jgi:hypothetical protein
MMLATVVDTGALAKVIAASLVAGIGVTAAFALGILGATRFADMRKEERAVEAAAYGAMALAAFAACVAAVVVGIVIMASK